MNEEIDKGKEKLPEKMEVIKGDKIKRKYDIESLADVLRLKKKINECPNCLSSNFEIDIDINPPSPLYHGRKLIGAEYHPTFINFLCHNCGYVEKLGTFGESGWKLKNE